MGRAEIIGYEDDSVCLKRKDVKGWFRKGQLHRINGPALESGDIEYWFKDGQIHRRNGPAVKIGNHEEYWENGNILSGQRNP